MYSIYQHSNGKGLSFNSFKDNLIEICNDHRNNEKALMFALIIYDFENPQLPIILQNEDYWRSLNQISGKYISVFSLNYKKPKKIKKSRSYSDTGSKYTSFLTSIPTDLFPSEGTELLINKYFVDKSDKIEYPAILFFQVDNNEVTESFIVELKEEETEKAYLELKEILKVVSQALEKVLPECRNNFDEIYTITKNNIESLKMKTKIKKLSLKLKTIFEIISIVSPIFKVPQ